MTEDKYSSKTLNVEAFILFKIKNKKKHITYSQKKKWQIIIKEILNKT